MKPTSKAALAALRDDGVRIVMATGDAQATAKLVADELNARMDKFGDKYPTNSEVKEMIRDTIVLMYKQLWLKSAVFIKQV